MTYLYKHDPANFVEENSETAVTPSVIMALR